MKMFRYGRIALAAALPAAGDASAPQIQGENGGLGANMPRTSPPEIGSGGSGQAELGQAADPLAAVRALGD